MYNFQGESDHGKDKYIAVCLFDTDTILLSQFSLFIALIYKIFFSDVLHVKFLWYSNRVCDFCLVNQVKTRCKSEWAEFQTRLTNADKGYLKGLRRSMRS